jgi:hypothetical protein
MKKFKKYGMLEPKALNCQQKEQKLTRKNLQSKPIIFRLFNKGRPHVILPFKIRSIRKNEDPFSMLSWVAFILNDFNRITLFFEMN